LSNCSLLEEDFLKNLEKFSSLSFLFLQECDLTGEFLKYVSFNLIELDLSEVSNLEEFNLKLLKRFRELQILHLDGNSFLNGNFLEFINPLKIQELGMSSTNVSLANFSTYIPLFVSLRILSIIGCQNLRGQYLNYTKHIKGYVFPP
jgi:hypothetical protein